MRGKHDKERQRVKPFHILGDVALTGERSVPVALDDWQSAKYATPIWYCTSAIRLPSELTLAAIACWLDYKPVDRGLKCLDLPIECGTVRLKHPCQDRYTALVGRPELIGNEVDGRHHLL